ncbi:TIGR02444 family protein [Pseudomonas zhanjiangensis]|uniref:TIGR02444 family protein n=1 Tax=Pseudomonas zhanjiangensis TaxID=3239015 RepID=A0ABV3YQJ5_9PSED
MPADLWRFAQDYYQRPGVEAACLQLQGQGADVCLLICAAWLGRRGVACSTARVAQLRRLAQPWQQEVVGVLRQVRQDWRDAARHDKQLAELRERVKQLEQEAERLQLQRLESLGEAWPCAVAADSLAWLEQVLPTACRTDRAALVQLRDAAIQP